MHFFSGSIVKLAYGYLLPQDWLTPHLDFCAIATFWNTSSWDWSLSQLSSPDVFLELWWRKMYTRPIFMVLPVAGWSAERDCTAEMCDIRHVLLQTNFRPAVSFWGICLPSTFILLRQLKLASLSILHVMDWAFAKPSRLL